MLRISTISFPGLGIENFDINSVAFSIGNIEIAWYALILTLGIVVAVIYTMWRARQVGITSNEILDYALFVVPSGIIGARVYYVLTSLEKYFRNRNQPRNKRVSFKTSWNKPKSKFWFGQAL